MIRTAFISIFLVALPGSTFAQGAFVPIEQVLAETASKPYECGQYDRGSKTCTSIAKMGISNGFVINASKFNLGPAPVIRFSANSRYETRNGWICGDQKKAQLTATGARAQHELDTATQFVRKKYLKMGQVCVGYIKLARSRYEVRFHDAAGNVLPNRTTEVRFFAQPPKLRP